MEGAANRDFFDLIIALAPVCISGLITFCVSKYNSIKNIPLDKYEIAYDRVYYPIYCLIKNTKNTNSQVIEKSEIYLNKYEKYIDRSTMAAFKYVKNNSDKERAYNNFTDNIFSMNRMLRKKLGYLGPDFFRLFNYIAPAEKLKVVVAFEILVIYFSLVFSIVFNGSRVEKGLECNLYLFIVALVIEGVAILLQHVITHVNEKKRSCKQSKKSK